MQRPLQNRADPCQATRMDFGALTEDGCMSSSLLDHRFLMQFIQSFVVPVTGLVIDCWYQFDFKDLRASDLRDEEKADIVSTTG
jgi:hypothetical protein